MQYTRRYLLINVLRDKKLKSAVSKGRARYNFVLSRGSCLQHTVSINFKQSYLFYDVIYDILRCPALVGTSHEIGPSSWFNTFGGLRAIVMWGRELYGQLYMRHLIALSCAVTDAPPQGLNSNKSAAADSRFFMSCSRFN